VFFEKFSICGIDSVRILDLFEMNEISNFFIDSSIFFAISAFSFYRK